MRLLRVFKFSAAAAIIISLVFFSCKRTQKNGIVGPEQKLGSSSFALLDSFKVFGNDRSLDYKLDSISFSRIEYTTGFKIKKKVDPVTSESIDTIEPYPIPHNRSRATYFKAKFNEVVTWKIEITAPDADSLRAPYKLISGTSDYIDSTAQWTWDGSSDNRFYFSPGAIDIRLTVNKSNDSVWSKSIRRRLVNTPIIDSATQGILLNDFEGNINITPFGDNHDLVPNPLPEIVSSSIDYPSIPQGNKAILLRGVDHNGDYFVGGNQQAFTRGILAGHAASDIYINVYIYGFPTSYGITPNATKIGIGVSQDNRNNDGKYDALFEDTFDQQISVDWVGWKLISVKYSNLKRSSSVTNGGGGPNKLQPETAVAVGCNILSSPNGSSVAAMLDYLIITFDKPLDK